MDHVDKLGVSKGYQKVIKSVSNSCHCKNDRKMIQQKWCQIVVKLES